MFFLDYDDYWYPILCEDNPDFDTTLVQALNDINETSINLGEHFVSETKEIVVVSSDELHYIFNSVDCDDMDENDENDVMNCMYKRWGNFYSHYENSDGTIEFTRIAFNDDKTQAILEMGRLGGPLLGLGSIIYLKKENDQWTIIDFITTWAA